MCNTLYSMSNQECVCTLYNGIKTATTTKKRQNYIVTEKSVTFTDSILSSTLLIAKWFSYLSTGSNHVARTVLIQLINQHEKKKQLCMATSFYFFLFLLIAFFVVLFSYNSLFFLVLFHCPLLCSHLFHFSSFFLLCTFLFDSWNPKVWRI